ncbi:MAG TPA: ATP-binding protein [Motilibacterales bacterium]|nr:ATP-binding protein [Motilibacterales bacterium]
MTVTPSRLRAPDEVPMVAVGVLLATGVGFLLALYIEAGNLSYTGNFGSDDSDLVFVTITFGLAVLGLLVLAFRPGHVTGRLLLGFGCLLACGLLTHALAVRMLLVEDPANQLGAGLAWAATWLFAAAFGLLVFVPATWPSGRIEARWLRRLAVAAGVALVALIAAQAVAPDALDGVAAPYRIDNPLGVPAAGGLVSMVTAVSVVLLLAFLAASVVDLAVRSVRASGQRVGLVVVVGGLAGLALLGVAAGPTLGVGGWSIVLVGLSFAGIATLAVLTMRAQRRTTAAEEARASLVAEREDERRRLRADLHDGLGPLLAALGLALDAPDDPLARARARSLLDDAILEVRRISRDLRPATLDELGLVGALQRQAAALTEAGGPVIEVDATPTTLPASVEVAAFRIASEAMTNAARHSGASRCQVRLDSSSRVGALHVEIVDDGTGVRAGRGGVGLGSMRERAERLGGQLTIGPGATGGTVVVAVLPVDP